MSDARRRNASYMQALMHILAYLLATIRNPTTHKDKLTFVRRKSWRKIESCLIKSQHQPRGTRLKSNNGMHTSFRYNLVHLYLTSNDLQTHTTAFTLCGDDADWKNSQRKHFLVRRLQCDLWGSFAGIWVIGDWLQMIILHTSDSHGCLSACSLQPKTAPCVFFFHLPISRTTCYKQIMRIIQQLY